MYSGVRAGSGRRGFATVGRGSSVDSAKATRHDARSSSEVRGYPFLFGDSGARLLADDGGKILWLSPGAAELANSSGCIFIDDGRLCGRTRHSDLMLRRMFKDVQNSPDSVDQLIARAANDLPELFVRARTCSGRAAGAVAVTMRQLDRKVELIPDLARLYGLTPTEEQITRRMVQGRSVTEIADEFKKSVLTVRTHIKRIYVKLNVGTKEQLFSAVIRLMVD